MYDTMMAGLKELGFERYEISNFAKGNSYSRHNLKYWHYVDYLALVLELIPSMRVFAVATTEM